MTDGWWRIKQHAPNAPGGFVVTEIPMAGITEQDVDFQHGPAFHHNDGRIEIFPWASIVHAEYQPPTKDTP